MNKIKREKMFLKQNLQKQAQFSSIESNFKSNSEAHSESCRDYIQIKKVNNDNIGKFKEKNYKQLLKVNSEKNI